MAMNFQSLLQLKSLWQRFPDQHPKFPAFLRAAQPALKEGSVIAFSITTPEGKIIESNLKVTSTDLELIESLKQMSQ